MNDIFLLFNFCLFKVFTHAFQCLHLLQVFSFQEVMSRTTDHHNMPCGLFDPSERRAVLWLSWSLGKRWGPRWCVVAIETPLCQPSSSWFGMGYQTWVLSIRNKVDQRGEGNMTIKWSPPPLPSWVLHLSRWGPSPPRPHYLELAGTPPPCCWKEKLPDLFMSPSPDGRTSQDALVASGDVSLKDPHLLQCSLSSSLLLKAPRANLITDKEEEA